MRNQHLRITRGVQLPHRAVETERHALVADLDTRTVIDERPQAAAALEEILDDLEGKGYSITGRSLRTAPKGFPRDHPRIELLRLQSFAALRRLPLNASRDVITATWDETEPLVRWPRRWVDSGADSL